MKKIIVIGCPGAGKSVFARELKKITGLPLHHLDLLWHREDATHISREEFDLRLDQILQEEAWIVDGNYLRTMEMRLAACDTVFLLDYPLEVCLTGAESRVGTKREDLPWVEKEFDEEFQQWIKDFPQNQLPLVYELIEKYRAGRTVVVFKSREDANRYLKLLSD